MPDSDAKRIVLTDPTANMMVSQLLPFIRCQNQSYYRTLTHFFVYLTREKRDCQISIAYHRLKYGKL